ncbi:phage tail protein [Sporosarcina sp. resist]|uniref:phage tail tube protein n=1 Tax=Sporosarcina sp. resist TaxID=2762563 RepID=UPI00164DAF4D|nr:phage tail tube protein [Sporosarcina sp. resist]QNK89440.1 phage tail protein [Sporosarcina sp. resist]
MTRTVENNDPISAKEGMVYITIEGKIYEYAELLKFKAEVKYIKADVKAIGKRMKGGKIVGAEGTGSMTVYYHRPEMREMALEYVRTGKSPIFDAQVVNSDAISSAGTQTALLKNLVPDGAVIAELDGESDDLLKEDIDFTFDDFDFLERFRAIA